MRAFRDWVWQRMRLHSRRRRVLGSTSAEAEINVSATVAKTAIKTTSLTATAAAAAVGRGVDANQLPQTPVVTALHAATQTLTLHPNDAHVRMHHLRRIRVVLNFKHGARGLEMVQVFERFVVEQYQHRRVHGYVVDVRVLRWSFAQTPREQVRDMAYTHVYVTSAGSGHYYSLFLPDHAQVVHMAPCHVEARIRGKGNMHFRYQRLFRRGLVRHRRAKKNARKWALCWESEFTVPSQSTVAFRSMPVESVSTQGRADPSAAAMIELIDEAILQAILWQQGVDATDESNTASARDGDDDGDDDEVDGNDDDYAAERRALIVVQNARRSELKALKAMNPVTRAAENAYVALNLPRSSAFDGGSATFDSEQQRRMIKTAAADDVKAYHGAAAAADSVKLDTAERDATRRLVDGVHAHVQRGEKGGESDEMARRHTTHHCVSEHNELSRMCRLRNLCVRASTAPSGERSFAYEYYALPFVRRKVGDIDASVFEPPSTESPDDDDADDVSAVTFGKDLFQRPADHLLRTFRFLNRTRESMGREFAIVQCLRSCHFFLFVSQTFYLFIPDIVHILRPQV
jgi:hypothetical protein